MQNLIENIYISIEAFEDAVTSLVKEAKTKEKKSKEGLDPKAKTRTRGLCVFPAEHPKVNDQKDHFPINDLAHARNAISRANAFTKAPEWYSGTVESFLSSVIRVVKKHYPSIDVSKEAKKPGGKK